MMKFITRGWGDGTDFIGTNKFRPTDVRADRRGLGDMICEVSNLYAQTNNAEVLVPYLHRGFNDFINLIDMNGRNYNWIVDQIVFNKLLLKSRDNESLSRISERNILHCYPDFDYVKLDSNKFVETEIPEGLYGTIQERPNAKKCDYDRKHIQDKFLKIQKEYEFPLISVSNLKKLGLAKIAYIIKHAVVHVGIDSGMTHFANTIKDKKDVHIYVPKDRITGVTYRWINQGFNVTLL